MMISNIVTAVVDYLAILPDGTVIATFDALNEVFGCEYARGGKYQIGDVEVDTMGLFGIDETVRQMAEKKGLILDSTYCADAPMGLPFHIPYIVSKNGVCGKEMEQQ